MRSPSTWSRRRVLYDLVSTYNTQCAFTDRARRFFRRLLYTLLPSSKCFNCNAYIHLDTMNAIQRSGGTENAEQRDRAIARLISACNSVFSFAMDFRIKLQNEKRQPWNNWANEYEQIGWILKIWHFNGIVLGSPQCFTLWRRCFFICISMEVQKMR